MDGIGGQQAVFRRVATAPLPLNDQFDFWRMVHDGLDMSLVDPAGARGYRASLLAAGTPDGVQFGHSTSAGTRTRFGDGGLDLVLLSLTLSGAVRIRHGHDGATTISPASGLTLLDYKRAAVVTTSGAADHGHLYLALPRRMATAAAGGDPVAGPGAIRSLSDAPLTPFLESHLRLLLAHGEKLGGREAAVALDVAASLALGCIGQAYGAPAEPEDSAAYHALFTAARHYIDLHCANLDLTAAMIAAALGCSRAHLYRVFAAHDTTVGRLMRDIRLEKARDILLGRRRGIEQIARIAGYASAASFSRVFKQRFGMAPGEWRASAGRETNGQEIEDARQGSPI